MVCWGWRSTGTSTVHTIVAQQASRLTMMCDARAHGRQQQEQQKAHTLRMQEGPSESATTRLAFAGRGQEHW